MAGSKQSGEGAVSRARFWRDHRSEAETLDSAPALGTLFCEKMGTLLLPRRLRRGPHLDDGARLNGLQRLGAGGEVRL
jgi:hypothetical protein